MADPKRYSDIKKRISQGLNVNDLPHALEQAHEDIKYLFEQIEEYKDYIGGDIY